MSYQLPRFPRRQPIKKLDYLAQAERRTKHAARVKDAWKLRQAAAAAAGSGHKIVQATPKKLLEKQLDHICKLIVFRRDMKRFSGYCLVCVIKREMGFTNELPRAITTPYHVLPRGDRAVRWDLRNIIGSCAPCNLGELMSRNKSALKARYRAIHSVIIGEDVLCELEALAKTTVDLDLIALRDERKAQLEGRA